MDAKVSATFYAVLKSLNRNFYVSSASLSANAYRARQVKILNKLIHGREKGKSKWYPSGDPQPMLVSASSISNPVGQKKHVSRRITVLNKLFMKYITDLMAMGGVSEEVIGRGVEISRVKVAQDFQYVNVFWLAKGNDNDCEIEKILKKCSGPLRHELSQLRLMGEVPRIQFVKDINFSKFVQIDSLLDKADFGEDYEPLDMGQRLKEDFIAEKLQNKPTETEEESNPFPEMRHDVFGLNHADIMNSIKKNIKRNKSAWEQYKTNSVLTDEDPKGESKVKMVQSAVLELNEKEQAENFARYLAKKQFNKNTPERKKFRATKEILQDNCDELLQQNEDEDFLDDDYDGRDLTK